MSDIVHSQNYVSLSQIYPIFSYIHFNMNVYISIYIYSFSNFNLADYNEAESRYVIWSLMQ